MPTIPDLTGDWGGEVYIGTWGLTGTPAGIKAGVKTGLTMRIFQEPGSNTARVQLRSGYFGRLCGPDEKPLSPFSSPEIRVCPDHVDIPLTDNCSDHSGRPGANPYFSANVGLITKEHPLNYGAHNTNLDVTVPYNMEFWTHACNYRTGKVDIYQQRHWVVRKGSVSPVDGNKNVPILEVRFIVVQKPGFSDQYWHCSGTLGPYHAWEPYIDPLDR